MQQTQTTKQSCYLLNPLRITEHKAKRKEMLVADFKFALNDLYCEAQCDNNFFEGMGSVIEHRKYLAELSEDELALSELYL